MKSRTFTTLVAITFFASLALPLVSPAQEEKKEHHHYKLFDVGTFGGPEGLFSNPGNRVINHRGTATGDADTAVADPYYPNCFYDCFVDHGFTWKDGVRTALDSLPGGLSNFPVEINNGGSIVGQSQNGTIDPLTGAPEVRSVLWRKGQIIDLGTLGGNASNASAITIAAKWWEVRRMRPPIHSRVRRKERAWFCRARVPVPVPRSPLILCSPTPQPRRTP
jgi:hypothetical protein